MVKKDSISLTPEALAQLDYIRDRLMITMYIVVPLGVCVYNFPKQFDSKRVAIQYGEKFFGVIGKDFFVKKVEV